MSDDLLGVRTTQRTSKQLKLGIIVAYIIVVMGLALLVRSAVVESLTFDTLMQSRGFIVGSALVGGGFSYRAVLSFLVWWHHS